MPVPVYQPTKVGKAFDSPPLRVWRGHDPLDSLPPHHLMADRRVAVDDVPTKGEDAVETVRARAGTLGARSP